LIEGIDAASPLDYGFFSGLTGQGPAPAGSKTLSLSNVDNFSQGNAFWGGIMEGEKLKAHCIPNYFNTKQTNIVGDWSATGNDLSANGQYTWFGGPMNGGTVPADTTLVVFARNSVRINSNIVYGPHNISNVPKFVLVVQGDIYIHPGVLRLDGWYITQPSGTSSGVIWTCHNGNSTPDDTFMRRRCNTSLDINGALTAKQINLGRINGDLSSSSAENIDFTPEMILGGPFFEDDDGDSTGDIQSLISLPPVF